MMLSRWIRYVKPPQAANDERHKTELDAWLFAYVGTTERTEQYIKLCLRQIKYGDVKSALTGLELWAESLADFNQSYRDIKNVDR